MGCSFPSSMCEIIALSWELDTMVEHFQCNHSSWRYERPYPRSCLGKEYRENVARYKHFLGFEFQVLFLLL